MKRFGMVGVVVAVLALAGGWASARAQDAEFEPKPGQAGKDVVWVPTPEVTLEKMLELAALAPDDYLVDLGSGDGRTVIAAARRGIRAHGIEYNPEMVALSRRRAAEAGVAERATFAAADIFVSDFSDATVVTLFLLPSLNVKLRPTLLDMPPGTRIVSNTFTMGDWEADRTERLEDGCTSWCTALLWIVPAKVEGRWRLGDETLTLTQTYQMIEGTLGSTPIEGGRLRGSEISFTAGGRQYTGRVDRTTIDGGSWTATRIADPQGD